MHFSVDISELITLDKAEFIVDYEKETSTDATSSVIEANTTNEELNNNDTTNNATGNLNITSEELNNNTKLV